MDRGNWWSRFFVKRVESIEKLDLVYRRKWNSIDWINDRIFDEDCSKDKWGKTMKMLNEKARYWAFPFSTSYFRRPDEEDYTNWHNIRFSKDEIEDELLKVFQGYPKYSAHTEEGIRNDELYQNIVAMMGFMQDVGAYYGVIRVGYNIDEDIIEAYITEDKNRYRSIMTEVIAKHDDMFSRLYNIKNVDKDIDNILNLQDKEDMKKKIKELIYSNCRAIFDKDTESISEIENVAKSCLQEFKNENKNILKLASVLAKSSKDDPVSKLKKMLIDC